jgi:hypothetical protein
LLPVEETPTNRRGYQAGATRSDGKWFALNNFYTNRLPTYFAGLSAESLERIGRPTPQHRKAADAR